MKSLANCITAIRILCSIALLFFPAFSTAFYTLYITAGVSDMVDGWIARLTLSFFDLKYSAVVVCCFATFAAIQEGHFIRTNKPV